MEAKIELYAFSNSKGAPMISGKERFFEIFKKYPGKKFFIEITCVEPENVIHHCWFIVKMIVPAFIRGYASKGVLLTPEEAIDTIVETCPMFYKSEKKYHKFFNYKKYEPETEMCKLEIEIAIDWLIIYCLKEFNIAIGGNKTI
jgi:hypothetical protein